MSTVATGRLRLHGYPVSNYFNIARAALLEKQASFDVVSLRANREREFLAASPMGKIPVLETPEGWLAETVAILEYLEDTVATPALYPANPFLRARARQIINVVQVYVEIPARSLFPGVFSNATLNAATIDSVRATLDRSTAALNSLARPAPFLLGAALTHADLFAFYCLDIVDRVTTAVYGRSILDELTAWHGWSELMLRRDSTQQVLADFQPVFVSYLIDHQAIYRLPGAAIDQPLPAAGVK